MTHAFDYMHVTTALDSISVQNIGDCCLHAFNDSGYQWYLLVTTRTGITRTLSIGPITNSNDELEVSKKLLSYDEKKIIKLIEKWLQDSRKQITQVMECDKAELFEKVNSINLCENL